MPAEHEALTTSGPELLDALHALLDALWADQPEVAAGDRMAFSTAVAEIAANVVEHASGGGPVPVRGRVGGSEHGLLAVVEDEGMPFVPAASEQEHDPWAETGRGLTMARRLSDELAYERDGAVNRWRVLRRRRG